jgi:hypothetical protein
VSRLVRFLLFFGEGRSNLTPEEDNQTLKDSVTSHDSLLRPDGSIQNLSDKPLVGQSKRVSDPNHMEEDNGKHTKECVTEITHQKWLNQETPKRHEDD